MCGNREEITSIISSRGIFCNSWRLLGDFCFLQGGIQGCNSRSLAGRRRWDLRVITGVRHGEQVEEREDSCAESNGCAKRIVALEWGKVSRGFFARSLVLAISRQKGGRPDLLDSLRTSGFLQSKREEANGGVHLQPL